MARTPLAVALVITAAALAGCSSSKSDVRADVSPSPSSTVALARPVVTEQFTPLDCDDNITIGMEGCAEADVLKADAKINASLKTLWTRGDASSRQLLVTAHAAWLAYRGAACASQA